MATKFLEPGGDADFAITTGNGFWSSPFQVTVATDFVHGYHLKSLKFAANTISQAPKGGILSDAGGRISFYIYFVAASTGTEEFFAIKTITNTSVAILKITSAGVLQMWSDSAQLGSNGSTLTTGTWYRISLAYTISSTTVNRFELFVNGISSISLTNVTLTRVVTDRISIGQPNPADATLDFRTSDHYVDDLTTLTDTGDIWVTAKRPNANGTTNGFTTQIGSGGSGYGGGHSPQVNERPLSTTNGWSMLGAGSAVTEEYNIQASPIGDIMVNSGHVIDYAGWVSASSLANETASIIVNGVTSNIALTSTPTVFTAFAGSTTYPAGTGADIGIITTTALTTVSLYECGILVAFIPQRTIGSMATMFW